MSSVAFAQGTITTVAGGTAPLDNIPAVEARLNTLLALAVDSQGNAYVGESDRVRRVDARTGIISTVVASTGARNLAFDPSGRLVIVSDSYSPQLLRYDPASGSVTPLSAPSTGTSSPLGLMSGMATDPAGNILITDMYNDKIYKVDATSGAVTTIAGTGMVAYLGYPIGDGGPATQAGLGRPSLMTVDRSGNIFFSEQYWIRRIDGKTGIISTIAKNGNGVAASGDGGPYANAIFGNPAALTTDAAGNLYVADWPHLREINWTTGIVSTVAGAGKQPYAGDGVPALQANIGFLTAVQADAQGNLWLADSTDDRVLLIPASTGLIRTVAGTEANGDGGPATGATISNADGLAATPQGDLYFMAGGLRRVDHITGSISTIAFAQAGPTLGNGSAPVAIDSAGDIYISEQSAVQRVDAGSGAVTTVAGGGASLGDGGPATKALVTPYGAAVDSAGNLFIADGGNQRIRRVDATTGIITTVAGNGQGNSFSGVMGHATDIAIGSPTSIAIAPGGDIYWTTNGWVLRMDAAGDLSIAAGEGGGCVYAGDGGLAVAAPICAAYAIAFDGSGNLFLTDGGCSCIRRVDAQTGIIQTVAGTGTSDMAAGQGSQDGIAATSAVLSPGAIAFAGGSLYLLDAGAPPATPARIRVVNPPVPPSLPQPPSVTLVADVVSYGSEFSPGAVVVLYGNYLWQQPTQPGQTGPDGLITSSLAGSQLTFNGIPAPLLYLSAGQINAVVPYAVKTGIAAVELLNPTGTSTYSGGVYVSPTSLRLYGSIIFNPDGSINSAAHPAPKSATLVMYGTGIGTLSPAVADGTIIQSQPFPMPVATFSAAVRSGGTAYPAKIAYLGPLPEFVAGAVQANIQIPDNVPAGLSNLTIVSTSDNAGTTLPIYMLSDAPGLTSVSPASPIAQSVGLGNYLTLTGTGLSGVTTFSFTLNGQPIDIAPQTFQACTSTSCMVFVNFAGMSGSFGVTVTNPAGQVSNQATFTVQPNGAPTVTGVTNVSGSGLPTASKGIQFVYVSGANFLVSDTVTLYRNGSAVGTFSPANPGQAQIYNPQLLQINVDFQGIAGQYAVAVSGTNGTSSQFAFTVNTP